MKMHFRDFRYIWVVIINNQMTKQEIVKELRTILKTYHYESNEQHISKDVVTSLENIIISLTS